MNLFQFLIYTRSSFLASTILIFLFLICCNTNTEYLLNDETAEFVGKKACIDCHKREYDLWLNSDHDRAMDTATAETVKGDFNNVEFEWGGYTHRMYRKGSDYYVHTFGPGGKPGDFKIAYTFGIRPLQQYIVPFENGRLQCLQIAWDSYKNKWFHLSDSLHGDAKILPDNWLYWTNNGQNMNGMCAECHTTNYKKNYDPVTHKFNTTWTEIDVSCEACHGPASNHLNWVEIDSLERPKNVNYGLVVQTSNINSKQYVDQCAYCHSRRSSFHDWEHKDTRQMNFMSAQLLSEPLYFADGQIFDEDYVYASFLQSKMYKNNVKCNDCHDVHSLKLKLRGNTLCYQCHEYQKYDSKEHHFHNGTGEMSLQSNNGLFDKGNGTQCVDCHMTGRYYMSVDFRRDHSFRIPRPDLTMSIGTPNACTSCHYHQKETSKWAAETIEKWYGHKPFPHFGTVIAAGRKGDLEVLDDLIRMSLDTVYTPIIRATALELMGNYYNAKTITAFNKSLKDSSDIIRHAAVKNYYNNNLHEFVNDMLAMLKDSTTAVRNQAALQLSKVSLSNIPSEQRTLFQECLKEYIEVLNHSADFAASMHSLGGLYANLSDFKKAEASYLEALRIDNLFYPSKINLAMLFNQKNQKEKAKILFKEVIHDYPDYYEAYYSLGLLLAEKQNYKEAAKYLEVAAQKLPGRVRIYYNLALIYQQLGNNRKAEELYKILVKKEPKNLDYLYAFAYFYVQLKSYEKAKGIANQITKKYPEQKHGYEILEMIKK